MLNGRRSQIAIGLLLLAIGLLGLALFGSREIVLRTQPHVEVDISNVDGTVQVSVNCSQAVAVTTGEALGLDLGFVPSDDRIFISTISHDHHPSWGFQISSNGSVFFAEKQGHAKTPLAPSTDANAVVFAEAFTAAGEELGSIGCQEPAIVSKSDVPGYVQSPDDSKVAMVNAEESPFQPRHFPYGQIDVLGRRSLPVLAVLGAIVAIGTPSIRRLAWSHKGGLVTGALAVLGAGLLRVTALPAILILAGALLLFAVAGLLVLGEPRVHRWYLRLSELGRGSRRS